MPNDQTYDPRTTNSANRLAQGIGLSGVATPAQGALTAVERRFTKTRNFEGVVGIKAESDSSGYDGAAGRAIYVDSPVYQGTTAGKTSIMTTDAETNYGGNGGGGFGKWGGSMAFPTSLVQGDELFIRFSMYYPAGFIHYTNGGGGRVKFLRVRTSTPSNSNKGYIDLYWDNSSSSATYKFIKEFSPDRWVNVGEKSQFPHVSGQWVTYNVHYILHSDPAIGKATFWRDGQLMASFNETTLSVADDSADFIYHFTYWNGTVPQDQHCYTDDWKITSDRNETVIDPVTGFPWIGV